MDIFHINFVHNGQNNTITPKRILEGYPNTIEITKNEGITLLTKPSNNEKYLFTQIEICTPDTSVEYEFFNTIYNSKIGKTDKIKTTTEIIIKTTAIIIATRASVAKTTAIIITTTAFIKVTRAIITTTTSIFTDILYHTTATSYNTYNYNNYTNDTNYIIYNFFWTLFKRYSYFSRYITT